MNKHATYFKGWEVLALLAVLLFIHGAYSAQQLIPVAIGVALLLSGSIIYRLLTKSGLPPLNWLSIGCFFIAVSYGWTLWNTLSVEQSLLKILEWLTYALLFMWVPVAYIHHARQWMLLFSSVFVFLHLALLMGMIKVDGSLLFLDDHLSASGMRLNGMLQYANATAAIAGALLLYHVHSYLQEQPWRYVNLLVMTGLAWIIWMTESRGALLVVLLAVLAALFMVEQHVRYLLLLLYISCSGFIGYVLFSFIPSMQIAALSVMILLFLCAFIIEKYNKKWDRSFPKVFIGGGVIVAGLGLLVLLQLPFIPSSIQQRLSVATLADRFIYMKDAWQAIQDYWMLGAGGEAWQFAMHEYQSAPYIANDLHMFYEQHLLETGIFGFLLMLFLVGAALWKVWQKNKALLPPIIVLLAHGCIDFTLSYSISIILLLLFIYEGMGESIFIKSVRIPGVIGTSIMAVVVALGATTWLQAENAFAHYEQTRQPAFLAEALDKNQFATRYYEALAQFADPVKTYETILKYEPHHARIHFYLGQLLEQEQPQKAFDHYELARKYDRFDFEGNGE
ncbi:O-antigen ligase family protein [Solibacillus sp. FSL W7-1464]|uniref:O-antigen ligase family protein n=1 Tax=Solibacillus sp. FSL W7-1464 TaxID=2921706 RepID=UPI0030F783B9